MMLPDNHIPTHKAGEMIAAVAPVSFRESNQLLWSIYHGVAHDIPLDGDEVRMAAFPRVIERLESLGVRGHEVFSLFRAICGETVTAPEATRHQESERADRDGWTVKNLWWKEILSRDNLDTFIAGLEQPDAVLQAALAESRKAAMTR